MQRIHARVAFAALVAISVGPLAGQAAAPPTLELTIEIVGLRSGAGQVLVSLFSSPDGFPRNKDKAARYAISPINKGRSVVKMAGLRPGTYAVSAVHDENGNRKLDTNWSGIPKEGIAASNDAKGTFGPPSFKAASFRLERGRTQQRLKMQYR